MHVNIKKVSDCFYDQEMDKMCVVEDKEEGDNL